MGVSKEIISQEFDQLIGSSIEPKDKVQEKLKKSFSKHFMQKVDYKFLEKDYDRIARLKEQYPIQEFMNLLGNHDRVVEIDLDKMFNL